MEILKPNKWYIYLILNVITLGLFTIYIACKLKVLDKKAWYFKWYYWFFGFLFGIIPGLVMLLVFSIIAGSLVSARIGVAGWEIYVLPYPWILCLIVPVLGWVLFIILYIYVHLWYVFLLKESSSGY